ncbi:MAG: YggS family pyridoxal phosphate-dependent enzyme [Desulfobulbaceae bacterium]|nr:YggS family pyridoxal phosphate-dependent enzyme [Desulfobulbaceae bacterium]MDY0351635.1 YggS family pyridoxal phosphate-dependent enzyme [Desulfobulbaceae bacterium]
MICANLAAVRKNIAAAARRCGRDPGEIELLAVSKHMDVDAVREAWRCGQRLFGENFVQEAREKIARLDPGITWHFIGHLQSNKTAAAARLFHLIETVDRLKVAAALDGHALRLGRVLDILVQVNTGLEKQKSGVAPENAGQFLKELSSLPNLRVRGLMTVPPYSPDPERSRPFFKLLKELAEDLRAQKLFADNAHVILSMGMSNDFAVAVEEGSTLVRIGTAIFGERT